MGDNVPRAKKFNTELTDYSVAHEESSGPYARNVEYDAIVVGAGFAGIFMLKTLRDRGYRTVIFEAGNDLGGTWRWNCYPGAMVDSEATEYQFSWPEVWESWTWPSNYPNYEDLRAYFDHVDAVVGVKKDCAFNTVVVGASFDTAEGKWTVRTEDGRRTKTKFLVLAMKSSRRYIPDWPGMDKFQGEVHHSSFWPDREIPVAGKRCAVIGTGASGVQIAQAWGLSAGSLTVFQRTPNLALPMRRRALTAEEQCPRDKRRRYPDVFTLRERTFAGFVYDWTERNTFDDAPAARRALWEEAWRAGGFRPWLAVHKDLLFDARANREVYDFWAAKARARIDDPRKRDLLAPEEPPHFFGIKRPCLELGYYELFNRDGVDVVDIRDNAIKEFTETGIRMQDGAHREFDVIAVATGFDVVTGVMTQLGLESIHGTALSDEWRPGATTYLGLTVPGYPNMFHLYGAHGPTLLANGPSAVEVQGRWIADCIDKVRRGGWRYVDARPEAARAWKDRIVAFADTTLVPTARSTFMGGSIPGKVKEPMCFMEGLPAYAGVVRRALDSMEGFDLVK
ncbi:steroid monooxygenase (CpmA) [Purpureocillium lavendulum]|uniref:Steroid monooxygenase (CpmA) n=1 Tax=Purpureocillium lavendulum TaxID=1247861 RepID=A0AB34FM34_9HYPO|nr:steroid monooxygenase (CpmA) [Purpureocillium lavendulum]